MFFSLLATACPFAINPYFQELMIFLSILTSSPISSGCITLLSSLHFQSLISALTLLSKALISFFYLFFATSNLFQNECSTNHSCAFLLDSYFSNFLICSLWGLPPSVQPLSTSALPKANTVCCHCQKSSQLTPLRHFPHPFMVSSSSSSIPLSSSSLLDLSPCPWKLCFSYLLETPHLHDQAFSSPKGHDCHYSLQHKIWYESWNVCLLWWP